MAVINGEAAAKMLADVPEDKRFYCSDGKVLKNLVELNMALVEMSDAIFSYHSNKEKTDFSNWVKDVVGDEKLARDLCKGVARAKAAKAVNDRIVWLRSKVPFHSRKI